MRIPAGGSPGRSPRTAGFPDLLAARRHLPAIGIVIRRVPVHVRDLSTSGCLLESFDALPEGCVDLLDLPDNAEPQREAIRICRVARVAGSPWPWRAGAHFLSLNAPSEASVRNVVARFEILDELQLLRSALH